MVKKSIRRAKLHYRTRRTDGGWGIPDKYRIIPWLNISGLWLEEAGFKVGDAIEIRVEQNTLTIKNCAIDGNKRD